MYFLVLFRHLCYDNFRRHLFIFLAFSTISFQIFCSRTVLSNLGSFKCFFEDSKEKSCFQVSSRLLAKVTFALCWLCNTNTKCLSSSKMHIFCIISSVWFVCVVVWIGYNVKLVTTGDYVRCKSGLVYLEIQEGQGDYPKDGQQVSFSNWFMWPPLFSCACCYKKTCDLIHAGKKDPEVVLVL